MENKNNNVLLFSVVFLVIGFLGGWFLCGNKNPQTVSTNTHMMPNGQMMSNSGGMMSDSMSGMMAGLNGKTGDGFDKAFLSEMIMHHEGAVQMAQSALQNAKHQEIRDMANAIISAQTSEINQMKGWQKSWYNIQN